MYSNIEKPIELEKHIDLIKTLTVNWQSALGADCQPKNGFFTQGKTVIDPFIKGWRLPWDMIDNDKAYDFNYHLTINPDPQCDWITSVTDLKSHKKKFREFITELLKDKLYSNILAVYEYGKNGKQYGKVHFHILFKTNKVNKLVDIAIKHFGVNIKTRWAKTVVKKLITCNKCLPSNSTNQEKVDNYREQIDYIMKEYMQKETHNRLKCLYSNIIKNSTE